MASVNTGGSQEMAVDGNSVAKTLIMTIQVNLYCLISVSL